MDVKYINSFLRAAQNIFETMIDLPLKLGESELKKDNVTTHEISSIIGISGEANGCFVVSYPETVALQLASALLGVSKFRINAKENAKRIPPSVNQKTIIMDGH